MKAGVDKSAWNLFKRLNNRYFLAFVEVGMLQDQLPVTLRPE
jgi:hypothetical protein